MNNRDKGWYDADRTFGEDVALLHSEVSEMLDAYRSHGLADATRDPVDIHNGAEEHVTTLFAKPEGVGSEAADVLIRLLDTCHRHGLDLHAEYERKMAYNRTRPHRHGGKRL